MSNIQKPSHQELIDELMVKLARYDQVKNEGIALLEDLNSLQKKLYEAGINYKIPDNLEYKNIEKQPSQQPKDQPVSKQLTYDLVLKTANSIMKEGRAVSAPVIAKMLGYEREKDSIREYLEDAVEKGLYEKRKGTMFAFPVKFDVYQPKGKDLPFLSPVVSTNEYKTMVAVAKKVVPNMKRTFTQKEFYQKLKPEMEKEGIAPKKIQMTVPSVLHDYVVKGVLKTQDQNTYTKLFRRKTKTESSKKSHNRISVDEGTKRGKAILVSPKDEREALSDYYRK